MDINIVLFFFSGSIPGPILFGKIIDITCLVWQKNCFGEGACFYYDNKQMSYNLLGVGVAFNVLSCAFFLLALLFYRSKPSEVTVNVTDPDNVNDSSLHTSMTTITQPPTPSSEHVENSSTFSTSAAPETASGIKLTILDQPQSNSV